MGSFHRNSLQVDDPGHGITGLDIKILHACSAKNWVKTGLKSSQVTKPELWKLQIPTGPWTQLYIIFFILLFFFFSLQFFHYFFCLKQYHFNTLFQKRVYITTSKGSNNDSTWKRYYDNVNNAIIQQNKHCGRNLTGRMNHHIKHWLSLYQETLLRELLYIRKIIKTYWLLKSNLHLINHKHDFNHNVPAIINNKSQTKDLCSHTVSIYGI